MLTEKRITLLSVATNDYLDRWKNLINQLSNDIKMKNWSWVLLTDSTKEAAEYARSLGLERHISIMSVLPFGFPLASMIRYPAILAHCGPEGWICYLDADMEIEDPDAFDLAVRSSQEVNVVSHPGYTRPKGIDSSLGIRQNIENIVLQIRTGGLGTWETRSRSMAFVPRAKRLAYAQAAIFFGPGKKIQKLCSDCWEWTEVDLNNGLIPIWHDESYLNRWITENNHTLLGPEFCFFDFPWLSGLRPIVRALHKNAQ